MWENLEGNLLYLHVTFMQAPVGMEAYRLSCKDKVYTYVCYGDKYSVFCNISLMLKLDSFYVTTNNCHCIKNFSWEAQSKEQCLICHIEL